MLLLLTVGTIEVHFSEHGVQIHLCLFVEFWDLPLCSLYFRLVDRRLLFRLAIVDYFLRSG